MSSSHVAPVAVLWLSVGMAMDGHQSNPDGASQVAKSVELTAAAGAVGAAANSNTTLQSKWMFTQTLQPTSSPTTGLAKVGGSTRGDDDELTDSSQYRSTIIEYMPSYIGLCSHQLIIHFTYTN